MTESITYCMAGCEEADSEGNMVKTQTEDGRTLCEECVKHLKRSLGSIPGNYVKLRGHLLPGSVERNPKATKNPVAPMPVRIAVVDLTDERHVVDFARGVALENVRGAVGILQRWANQIRVQRRQPTKSDPTIHSEVRLLENHFDWMVKQPWVAPAYKDINKLARTIKDTIGIFRGRPVGNCTALVIEDDNLDPHECGGPLFPITPGVMCIKCHRKWPPEELRRLGMLIRVPV